MSTCQTASNANPDDEWVAEDCLMVFDFPDDEALIQAEYAKNVPFALAVARSAADPDDPVSVVGRSVPDLVPDAFADSYGTSQPVAVLAKRALKHKRLRYSVNGGPTRTATVSEWTGGERYGDGFDRYIAEYRGTVSGTARVTPCASGSPPSAARRPSSARTSPTRWPRTSVATC